MPKEKDPQDTALEKVTQSPIESAARNAESGDKPSAGWEARSGLDRVLGANDRDRVLGGLERIREILLGDILVELERRLARIDSQLANRTSELQQDARHRIDVLEAHVRKEIDALSARAGQDNHELNDAIQRLRFDQRAEIAQIEQRLTKIEERVDTSITRLERETRQQLLDQSKSFLNDLERVRHQLRSAIVRELGLEPAPLEEGGEHDTSTWTAPH
jgi:tetrahydromethanopterin S-methyltransferase subunit G